MRQYKCDSDEFFIIATVSQIDQMGFICQDKYLQNLNQHSKFLWTKSIERIERFCMKATGLISFIEPVQKHHYKSLFY